jgi:hypothetical protein
MHRFRYNCLSALQCVNLKNRTIFQFKKKVLIYYSVHKIQSAVLIPLQSIHPSVLYPIIKLNFVLKYTTRPSNRRLPHIFPDKNLKVFLHSVNVTSFYYFFFPDLISLIIFGKNTMQKFLVVQYCAVSKQPPSL